MYSHLVYRDNGGKHYGGVVMIGIYVGIEDASTHSVSSGLPAPPTGYAYLVDDQGRYILDDAGNYILVLL